ncbi:hypothetical protein Pla175_37580 [Pirellulimonas nuda]|uniref:DUF4440 domain-containing protein n=1 Tax=Pirellulimonas nuda TaxID=2528009 RepID=A0A518DFW0_9BACT|nr:nuclear transport factor 2 family protein [Pirellulimonas nuda]QDU90354.1 hypothetical protein Pla175_37580 [Pirellulimonas nuda]
MPRSAAVVLGWSACLLMVAAEAVAQQSQAEQAVRAASKAYTDAARRGDVGAMAKMWTERGDYIDSQGYRFNAQAMLRPQPGAPAAAPGGSTAAPAVQSTLRMVTPDVAIEDGKIGSITMPDGSRVGGRFTAVWVRRDGKWLLDGVREAAAEAPPLSEKLMPLAWLLGEWAGQADDTTLLMSAHPSDGGNYIVREFLVKGDARESIGGEQRIGWDPESKRIKVWSFDSQGGAGEGFWRQAGDTWVLDTAHVLPDGTKTTTSNVYTPQDADRFVWEVKPAAVDGARLPAMRVEFRRAPEAR